MSKLNLALIVFTFLISFAAVADTKVQSFSQDNYTKFIQANPKVKIITVTPITTTDDRCPTASVFCADTHTSELLVTYEE